MFPNEDDCIAYGSIPPLDLPNVPSRPVQNLAPTRFGLQRLPARVWALPVADNEGDETEQ